MSAIFAGTTFFNADLSKWVVDMSTIFRGAVVFNGNISKVVIRVQDPYDEYVQWRLVV